MKTTIVVTVTVKIDAEGDTPDELISNGTLKAMSLVEDGLERLAELPGAEPMPTVEGASALVNQSAIEEIFS